MSLLKDAMSEDEIPTGMFDIFKKGKIQCRIYYEDGSYKDFFKKFDRSYTIDIKGRSYFVTPRCLIRGKRTSICWFFNNPMPINFDYQSSKLTAKDLIEPAKVKAMDERQKQIQANITIDAEGVNAMFNTRLMQGLYSGQGMSVKNLIIIMIALGVVVLVILQMSGTIDIQGMILGK